MKQCELQSSGEGCVSKPSFTYQQKFFTEGEKQNGKATSHIQDGSKLFCCLPLQASSLLILIQKMNDSVPGED